MRLTTLDAAFLYLESASGPMHVASIVMIEGELDYESAYRQIDSRLHLVPRCRQRIAMVPLNLAHPKWVDDPDFDLANHFLAHRVPAGSTVEDAVQAAIELNEPMLRRDRPLWRMHLIQGVKDRTVLLQTYHHAMIDGASGIAISLVMFDLQKNAPQPEPEPWAPEPPPNPLALAGEGALESARKFVLENPFKAVNLSTERTDLLRRATETLSRFALDPVLRAPWNAAPVGPKRNFKWTKYPFGDFRHIRSVFGGTINDVVLTAVSEGAARYLKAHDERTEGRHLRILCPVNVRTEDERGALGNRVSAIFPMFVAEPMDVTERLEKVRWETEQIKNNREAQALQLLVEDTPDVPPVAMAPTQLVGTWLDPTKLAAKFPLPVPPKIARRLPLFGFNFICTNVPGVATTQYIAGHRILDNLGVLLLGGNQGFAIVVLSYDKNLYLNYICDPRLLPDLDLMVSSIDDAFADLLAAAERVRPQPASAVAGQEKAGAAPADEGEGKPPEPSSGAPPDTGGKSSPAATTS